MTNAVQFISELEEDYNRVRLFFYFELFSINKIKEKVYVDVGVFLKLLLLSN